MRISGCDQWIYPSLSTPPEIQTGLRPLNPPPVISLWLWYQKRNLPFWHRQMRGHARGVFILRPPGEYVAWISYLELEAFERAEAQKASRR